MNTLWHLKENASSIIISLGETLPKEHSIRLEELGIRKSAKVKCLRKTPFGGPSVFLIGDSVYSLAKDVALCVEIEG